jgi:glucose dehydrogenase/plastocyanin
MMSSHDQARVWVAVAVSAAVVALTLMSAPLRSAGSEPYSGKEWAAPGGDWASTRYSTLAQINARNITQLGGAWVVETPDRAEATPMVKDGRMFVVSTAGVIMALDPATGATLWTFKPETAFSGKRGIGIGDGLLFAGLRNSNVMAIGQATGTLVWTSEHPKEIPAQGMATAPAYGNGVVVGVVSLGDNFLHGRAIGYAAKTGKFLWSFDVVPGPGETGHETWPQDSDVWKYGGGAIWTTPSVDAELGLVYLPTGNAVPQYGGELRPGNNLFDNSVVALDLKTGKMRWYFQVVHHDIWEHDLSTPLVMYDTTFGGQRRKALAAMRTDGILFILDRETGKPLVPVEERPVRQDPFLKTSPTQPFTRGGDRVGPGCVNPAWMKRANTGWEFIQPTRLPGQKQYGVLAAIDARTAKIAWQKRLPYSECEGSGGALTTAGGLMFHSEPDGVFQAYDAKTGDERWRFQTGELGLGGAAGPSGAAAMTYESRGGQFVALANNRVVWAFTIGGTVPPRPAPAPPAITREWAGRIADTSAIQLGAVTTFNIASANKKVDWADDNGLSPSRARTKSGTPVIFTNASKVSHTIAARDGSWSTGVIQPGASGGIAVIQPGTYEYTCTQHPWTIGQLTVE